MIYGQMAKQYAKNNSNYKVVSESDSIINYLLKEQDNYSNLLLNESYITEEERLVMEAKYEVLQEAVIGAVIAAIIALIGILIALLSKATGTISTGAKKLNDRIKKDVQEKKSEEKKNNESKDNNSAKYSNGTGPIVRPESDESKARKIREREEKEERDRKYKEDMKELENKARRRELIEYAIRRYNSNYLDIDYKSIIRDLSSDEEKDIIKKIFGENNDDFNGISTIDFTLFINPHCMDTLNGMLDKICQKRDQLNYINKDDMVKLMEYLEDEEKIDNEILFDFQKNHVDSNLKSIKEKMVYLYNSKKIDDSTILWDLTDSQAAEFTSDTINRLYKSAESVQNKLSKQLNQMKTKLERLKKDYVYGRNSDNGDPYENKKYNNMYMAAKRNKEGNLKDHWENDANLKYFGKGEKGETNIEKFQNHVLRVEKTSLSHFQNFLTTWIDAEQKRITNLGKAYLGLPKQLIEIYKIKLYNRYSSEYGKDFTDRVKNPNGK